MSNLQDRRTFLAAAGITVASVITPRLLARDDKPKKPTLRTREDVEAMDADHPTLVSYRKAVGKMKGLKADNPLSWEFQANMHGVPMGTKENEAWHWCMHGNWWFLPWHRGYVYYFERIIRKMAEEDGFRLPYWAWEKDGQNVLAAPFRDLKYGGKDNPLFDSTRSQPANKGLPLRPDQFGSFAADWGNALAKDEFSTQDATQSFGGLTAKKTMMPERPMGGEHGAMESLAHDMIHIVVGGAVGNMAHPQTAARDPIFWLHHANVDRLWNRWLDIKAHHIPDKDDYKDWYDQPFPYYDEDGKKVVKTVGEILELAAQEAKYDDDRKLFAAAPPAKEKANRNVVALGSVAKMLKLTTKQFDKPLEITAEAKPKLKAAFADVSAEPTVLLRVEGIKPPKDAGLTFEVFLMKKGDKPSKKSYVGPITFFGRGSGHGDEEKGFTQGFDVTRIVKQLRIANKGEVPELQVSVVPHSTDGLSAVDLAKKDIEVPVSDITLKLVEPPKK